jgi:hypothetical protein
MARNPVENPVSLTEARKAYARSLFDLCYAKVALDLDNETTTEMIAIPVLAQIAAVYCQPPRSCGLDSSLTPS